MTAPEVAALGVWGSVRNVQRLARSGELPVVQQLPGKTGAFLFDRAEIERLQDAS